MRKDRKTAMMKLRKTVGVMITVSMIAGLAGCGSSGSNGAKDQSQAEGGGLQDTQAGGEFTGEPVEASYPLTSEKKQLTVYAKNSNSSILSSYQEIQAFEKAAETLGVELVWTHPVAGSETDQYNLMIASQELPDIIFWDFSSTSTKLTGLIDNGSAIDMDSLIRQYAPNYLKALETEEEIMRQALTDEGKFAAMYKLEPTPARLVTAGPLMRKDLLEQYGLEVPVTIEDWYKNLKTFKENGMQAPLTVSNSEPRTSLYFTMSAFQTYYSFYIDPDTGKIAYGPITENYREWLREMKRWYGEGLIDPEYTATDRKTLASNMTGGKSGATMGLLSATIGNLTSTARTQNPDYELVGCPWPVKAEGDTPYVINYEAAVRVGGMGAVVTSSCQEPVLAVQVLDYFYSEEGQDLLNWGIEGVTYEKDGSNNKKFTDGIMKEASGKTPSEAIAPYAIPALGFTKMMDYDAWAAINLSLPEQFEANKVWAEGSTGMMLPNLELTSEKNDEYNKIMNEIKTYVDENQIKFITGALDVDSDFEKYVDQIKKMKIETAAAYMQEAYDAYKNR